MTSILLTNDDGPKSAPFAALLDQLSRGGELRSIIPSRERSWIGKSITPGSIPNPESMKILGHDVTLVQGTPADCVQLGIYNILPERPDLVVSGMNIGENVGIGRMLSSGTIGGALEAAIAGIRSVSVSVVIPKAERDVIEVRDPKDHENFRDAASIAFGIIRKLRSEVKWNGFQTVSINIPFRATRDSEVVVTKPSTFCYGKLFERSADGFIHRNPSMENEKKAAETDVLALSQCIVSITPICIDMTSEEAMVNMREILKGGI